MHTENDDHIQQLLAQHEDDILTIRTMQLVPMQPGDVPITFIEIPLFMLAAALYFFSGKAGCLS